MKALCGYIYWLLLVVLAISCNVYRPLDKKNSAEDYLEAALVCEHKGDFDCAIDNYLLLPEGDQRLEKLCAAYLVRAGLTLKAYVNVISVGDPTMLGSAAREFAPWTEKKSQDAQAAIQSCGGLSGSHGVLLKSISLIADCAIRIAKTDEWLGSSLSDTTCQTPGNRDQRITKQDINSDLGIMCPADVMACRDAFSQTALFGQLQQGDVKAAYDIMPQVLKDSSAGVALVLIAIHSTVPE